MEREAVEFLKHASLLGCLNLLTFTIFVCLGLWTMTFGVTPAPVSRRIRWVVVPLLIGLVTMCLGYYSSERMLHPSEEWIAAYRRDALIHGVIGVFGAMIFVSANLIARERKIGTGVKDGGANGI